ncbi:MAG: SDR family NAD(P)-dependent oxidoreductase [Sphingobium sp.]|nr:SDR family NAD(P)-dependent oxidoreductase [Sphingobium sp.]MBP9157941.1 SDR family NAD(P)-dependent oxidoreductase [Sphingobium sp.]
MSIDLSGRVAIITGAGGGLGRAHAHLLASRGAMILVNDLGGATDGSGGSISAAQTVVEEIQSLGGEAFANGGSVTDYPQVEAMVADAVAKWGRVDILINNAGILRDRTFAKMTIEDFRAVVDVHLMGAVNCTKAVWDMMREQKYGRIVMTTSSSGLYGNFGQSNYGAAKMALVGLMQTLGIEGEKYNVRVNCLAPTGATRMVGGIFPEAIMGALKPDRVSPAVLALCAEDAPSRKIICAGAGSFEQANITLTQGLFVDDGADAAERLLAGLDRLADRGGEIVPENAFAQSQLELAKAGFDINAA